MAIERTSRSRLLLGAALTATALAGVLGAQAQGPEPGQPGAVGNVSGQTPSQAEQAQRAPVQITPSAGDYDWWAPGDERPLAAEAEYRSTTGRVGLLNTSGVVATKGHPFFSPIGVNGRACVTCPTGQRHERLG